MEAKEIKIITLGNIFDNLETEEQAFKFLKYIKNQQQELEKYKNIIDELEKTIKENKFWIYDDVLETRENFEVIDINYITDKLKELKGE